MPDVGRCQTELSSFSASAPCGSGRSTQTGEPSVAVPYRVSVDAVPSVSPIVRSAGRGTILPNLLNRQALPVAGPSQEASQLEKRRKNLLKFAKQLENKKERQRHTEAAKHFGALLSCWVSKFLNARSQSREK